MGIRLVEAFQLYSLLGNIKSNRFQDGSTSPHLSVCSLGFPDFLFNINELESYSNGKIPSSFLSLLTHIPYSSDLTNTSSAQIKSFVDPYSFFAAFNASLDIIDVHNHRGCEIIADLNYSNSTSIFAGKYDLVIDNGTLEHCFNIGEALINTARLVRSKDSYIFHINPLSMINHGFYNLCPTLFYDFYSQNFFKSVSILVSGLTSLRTIKVHPVNRFVLPTQFSQEELIMNYVVKSNIPGQQVFHQYSYPIQSKYKKSLSS